MVKLGDIKPKKSKKLKPVLTGKKIGTHPVKVKPVYRSDINMPPGGILAYTIDSPPEAYQQQQMISSQLHDQYLAQLTPNLNDLIGGVGKVMQFILTPKNWLTIGGVLIGVFLVLLTVNALLQSEGKAAVSGIVQSQGFKPPKRKK